MDITINNIHADPEKISVTIATPVIAKPIMKSLTREQQARIVAIAQKTLDRELAILKQIDDFIATPEVQAQIEQKKEELAAKNTLDDNSNLLDQIINQPTENK